MSETGPYHEHRGMPRFGREESLPKETGFGPTEKSTIILVLLHMELGTKLFCQLINDCAIDMEVAGIIDSADRAKVMAETLATQEATQKLDRQCNFICEQIGCRNGDEIMADIAQLMGRVQELRTRLYQNYYNQASNILDSILNESKRRASLMRTGCSGKVYTVLEHISQKKERA